MGASADVEDERLLKPRDQKVSSFADGIRLDSLETIEYHGALATVDGVETGIGSSAADSDGECGARYVIQRIRSSLRVCHIEICRGD